MSFISCFLSCLCFIFTCFFFFFFTTFQFLVSVMYNIKFLSMQFIMCCHFSFCFHPSSPFSYHSTRRHTFLYFSYETNPESVPPCVSAHPVLTHCSLCGVSLCLRPSTNTRRRSVWTLLCPALAD